MMRYLTQDEVIELHRLILIGSGGAPGIRDMAAIDSAVAQPRMTFDGKDLYPTVAEKAAALAFSLVRNNAFLDGNKRVSHAAMEAFLVLNGYELSAPIDEQEHLVLRLAASQVSRDELTAWVRTHVIERQE